MVLILSQAAFVPTGQPSWALSPDFLSVGIIVAGWDQAQLRTFVQLDITALEKAKRNYPEGFLICEKTFFIIFIYLFIY